MPLRTASWRVHMNRLGLRDCGLLNALAALAVARPADAPAHCAALDEVVRAAQALRRSVAGGPGAGGGARSANWIAHLQAHLDEMLAAVRAEQAAIARVLPPDSYESAADRSPRRPLRLALGAAG